MSEIEKLKKEIGRLKGGYTGNNLEEFDFGIHGGCCVYGGYIEPNILTPSGFARGGYTISSSKDLLKDAKIGKTED